MVAFLSVKLMFANTGHFTVVWSPSQTGQDFTLAFVAWFPLVFNELTASFWTPAAPVCNAWLLCGTIPDWLVSTDCDLTDELWVEVCPSQRAWFAILALAEMNLENSSKLGKSSALTTTSIHFLTSHAGNFLRIFLFSNSSLKMSKHLYDLLAMQIWFK